MTTIYIDATREIVPYITSGTNWSGIICSGICALIGAYIGGRYVLKSADKSHQHNIELADRERKNQEKITIISLVEELKVIMGCYKDEFIRLFSTLKSQKYLTTTYIITQEYFTVYKNNADKLGLIQNEVLRNLFIKIHIQLNRFIENLCVYKNMYNTFCERRIAFLNDLNPDIFKSKLFKNLDTSEIIAMVSEDPSKFARKDIESDKGVIRLINFFTNDAAEAESLRNKSIELSDTFNEIVNLYNEVIEQTDIE